MKEPVCKTVFTTSALMAAVVSLYTTICPNLVPRVSHLNVPWSERREAPRKYVFLDAVQYFAGQRYTLTKLQNAGKSFKLFLYRVLTTAKKAQNLERIL